MVISSVLGITPMVNCKENRLSFVTFLSSGLSDKDSRTSFVYVANIGAKNVYRIFAGGNHSWVVIDDIMPVRRRHRPPSPVPNHTSISIIGAPTPISKKKSNKNLQNK